MKKKRKKRAYIERHREEGHIRLWNDYFSETPTYPENIFRQRFRKNKRLFMHIVYRLSNEVHYFREKTDALRRNSFTPLQKCTAAIRILVYGSAADTVDEYLRLDETTTRLCVEYFVEDIIYLFGDEYLRRPTPADLQHLLNFGEYRGFPGMIGSIDCMHWEWKNSPTAWKGQYSRGSGKPTIVLEAVASFDLWIWHAFFGPPGTLNDINVLDRSPVFDDIINGQVPNVTFFVNGRECHMAYYLTDGIYPKWAIFIQSIPLPQEPEAVLFAKKQEAARKDVERAFGVLQARFAIVKNPALFWDKVKIGNIMRACIILHNMIVEDERDEYIQYDLAGFNEREDTGTSHVDLNFSSHMPTHITEMMEARNDIRDRQMHQQLKDDLVQNIWHKYGSSQDNN
uniref:DDE Tnp4 domain-containing protein n=1 Tax=Brassica oleracea var. oleracea TaxID=109376 RepID=A0A0D3DC36_BRAOL